MITHVCILGERVSGTTYLQSLITSNTNLKICTSFGHKHFYQNTDLIKTNSNSHILFLFITRDVIEWLQSLMFNSFHTHKSLKDCLDFSRFIRTEWQCIHDSTSGMSQLDKRYGTEMLNERDPETGLRFRNAIKMRTSKLRHIFHLKKLVQNFVHIRYEDVRDEPELFLKTICITYNIFRHKQFTPIVTVRGKGNVKYVQKQYPEVSIKDIEFIMTQIDFETEKLVGYCD